MYIQQSLHLLKVSGGLNEAAQAFFSDLLKNTKDHNLVVDDLHSAAFRSDSSEFNKPRGTLTLEFAETADKSIYKGLRSLMRGLGDGTIDISMAEVGEDGKVIDAYDLSSNQLQLNAPSIIKKKRDKHDSPELIAGKTVLIISGTVVFDSQIARTAQSLLDESKAAAA